VLLSSMGHYCSFQWYLMCTCVLTGTGLKYSLHKSTLKYHKVRANQGVWHYSEVCSTSILIPVVIPVSC